MFDDIVLLFRQSLRTAKAAPALSITIIVTIGLALATSMTAFAVLRATVLLPPPFADPDRIAFLAHTGGAVSPPLFLDYRRGARAFVSLSAVMPWTANLTGNGEPERVSGLQVSADFFSTLGVSAAHGRTFTSDEEQPGRDRVVVLSDALWRRRFAANPALLHSTIQLNGDTYEVVGIMPRGFGWGRAYGREAEGELWAPFALTATRIAESSRGNEHLDVYGRLGPGATFMQAQAQLDGIVESLRARFPNRYTRASGFRAVAVPLHEELVKGLKSTIVLLFVAGLSLLLVAVTNVAGLLVTRASGRRREAAVRTALGASRARLAALLVAEVSLLMTIAGALGLSLAWLAVRTLDRLDRVALPRTRSIELDAVGIGVALLAIAGLIAAISAIPAWHVAGADSIAWLRTAASAAGGGRARRSRQVLIVAQTAVALTLLAASGLLVRSLIRLQAVPVGFRADGVLTARLQLPLSRYPTAAAREQFVDAVLSRMSVRQTTSVAVVSELPMSGLINMSSFEIFGRPVPASERQPHADSWSASSSYFRTLGIGLRRGRYFDDGDNASRKPVAIVNQALVDRYFNGIDPIGQQIDFQGGGSSPNRWREIVGVVDDVVDRSLDRTPGPQVYAPFLQRPSGGFFLVARSTEPEADLVADVKAAVRATDPDLPVFNMATMPQLMARTMRDRRVAGTLLSAFGLAAMGLAAMGLYALLSQIVRERTPEIGIRVAIGARPADVVRQLLGEGARLVLHGLWIGGVASLAAMELLQGLVFGVTTMDPVSYAGAGIMLAMVALAACLVPAFRAARLDPLLALRRE